MSRYLPGADPSATEPRPRPDAWIAERYGDESAPAAVVPPLRWALPICAAHLRDRQPAMHRLDPAVRVAALARVARSWMDSVDPLRQEALERVPAEAGLSPESIAWGLDRAFEVLTADALREWGPPPVDPVALSGHVWAGNVITAGLPPVIGSLLAGVPALIKAPGDLPAFAELFAQSLAQHAPELGDCLGAAAWSRDDAAATDALLSSVDRLYVFGNDASIDALRQRAEVPVAGFGHRLSVAVVGEDATDDELTGLLVDSLAWDGGGCLTPTWAFVLGDADAVGRRLAALAPSVSASLPPVPGDLAGGAARANLLGVAGALGFAASGAGWAVVAMPALNLVEVPPRTVCLLPADLPAVTAAIESLGPVLQGVATAGTADLTPVRGRLDALGLSLVAPAGRLQTPPLDWNHDGVDVLGVLQR